jgi:hypothetical protein
LGTAITFLLFSLESFEQKSFIKLNIIFDKYLSDGNMQGKKGICKKCGTKTAIYEEHSGKYKCHICGTEFDEPKFELLGNYNVFQDFDEERVRFVKFIVEENQYKIVNDGGRVTIIIKESN